MRPGPSPPRVYPGSEEKGLACEASGGTGGGGGDSGEESQAKRGEKTRL